MPVEVSWYKKGRVILQKYEGDLTLEDLATLNHDVRELSLQNTGTVHMIADMRKVGKIPFTFKQLRDFFTQKAEYGWVVSAGSPNKIVNFLLSLTTQMMDIRYRSFNTFPEAVDFLEDIDPTIKD